MAERAEYRELPAWQTAMAAAEAVFRLAARLRGAAAEPAVERLLDAAARLPVAAGTGAPDLARRAAEVEILLLLTGRLAGLPEPELAPALRLLADLAGAEPPSPAPAPGPEARPARRLATAEAPPEPPDRLILDGCNFLGRAPEYSLSDPASRDRLLFRLQEYSKRHPAHRVIVYFDGQRASRRITAGVEERVTSGRRPADDVIIQFLEELSLAERRRATLVTDDRDLGRRARALGVKAESVSWLAEKFQPRQPYASEARKQSGLNRTELEEWENYFNEPPKRP